MSAKKDQEILSHNLIIRVTETTFKRLEKMRNESNCASIAEIARRILSNQRIKLYYQDTIMSPKIETVS